MPISYANGKFIPTDKLAIPFAADITGTVRGYRIFTACRTIGDKIFRFDDHLNRVLNSTRAIHMKLAENKSQLKLIVEQTVRRNRQARVTGDLLIEIVYSGGPAGPSGVAPSGPAELYVVVFPLKLPPEHWLKVGMKLATYPFQRQWPEVKLLNYVGGVVAHQTVVKKYKADEALFISPDRRRVVLEGTTFNFFLVRQGVIMTHPLNGQILSGITRQVTLDLARKAKLPVREARFNYADLKKAAEAFITSSTRNVVPVVKIDGFKIGTGRPGPVTRKLMTAMMEYQAYY